MSTSTSVSKDILGDIQDLYLLALQKGNISVALKAKELLGREYGLFVPKSSSAQKEKMDLSNISDDDIHHLIEALEAKLKLDHL